MADAPTVEQHLRAKFFDYLFGEEEGYVCIATSNRDGKQFNHSFFQWPKRKNELVSFLEQTAKSKNVYFCVNLLSKAERKKDFCLPTHLVWGDLDYVTPDEVKPEPQVIIESSPGRYQMLWQLPQKVDPAIAEDYARRIEYAHKTDEYLERTGDSRGGWDLTQLLRVPFTTNFKHMSLPVVQLHRAEDDYAAISAFEKLPQPSLNGNTPFDAEVPDLASLPRVDNIIYKYAPALKTTGFNYLYGNDPGPEDDWSKLLWRLINICYEVGMDREEAFVIAYHSKCNKYQRDNRPVRYLWREVLKAEHSQAHLVKITGDYEPISMPTLLRDDESDITVPFVDDYIKWGIEQTDAVQQYHELSAVVLLSSVLSENLKLDTSYGEMVPNVWGLILGDSTLTRKSTAMRMATDFLGDIDPEIVLATDGSIEGLLQGLSLRPGRASLFFKDEVSGFLHAFQKRDYLAGMPEMLTQLYDVPQFFTRRLRKETITISRPIFIFYGGGIRERTYEVLDESHVLSGFLPRFLIVSGDTDLKTLRRTGPATLVGIEKRAQLLHTLQHLYEKFHTETEITVLGQKARRSTIYEAFLTPDAWERYGDIEMLMVKTASDSYMATTALPTFERLSRSLLKISVLLAAARQGEPDRAEKVTVEPRDVVAAARLIQDWGRYSVDLLLNVGKSISERTLNRIMRSIENNPGIMRSTLMNHHHLSKQDANHIFDTLEDRGLIKKEKVGRGYALWKISN